MPKTIEQRWKAVGVNRETVAKESFAAQAAWTPPHIRTRIWSELSESTRYMYRDSADAILPLIENAVREGRRDEARRFSVMLCNLPIDGDSICHAATVAGNRIAELEAGE